ncbi:MAG: hypothetical protein WC989_07605 [Micavibrio sp.]
MNIDLFHTGAGEAGLLCGGPFKSRISGAILDAQTLNLTLELGDGDTFHLNIPVAESNREKLLFAHKLYIGFFEESILTDAFEVPLLYLNDPYGSEFGQSSPLAKPRRSVLLFEQFMKRCAFAQPLHRDNLGDEDSARSLLRGADPKALTLSPALMRQIELNAIPTLENVPQMPGPGGAVIRQKRAAPSGKTQDEQRGE